MQKQAGAVEIWVIVESIYSMEGKMAPLREIADATKKEGGRLFIDDSHAVGVLGPHGAGGPAFCGLVPGEDYTAHVFSLCKAFNAGGGAICGASGLVRMIRYRCIAYSFSAGIAEPLKVSFC